MLFCDGFQAIYEKNMNVMDLLICCTDAIYDKAWGPDEI
jgi:hypothetical protein